MKQFKFGFGDDEQMEVKHMPQNVKKISDSADDLDSPPTLDSSKESTLDSHRQSTEHAPLTFAHDFSSLTISSIPSEAISQEDIIKNEFYVPVYDEEHGREFDEKVRDLVPGSYEGGKRVWEASRDLARYAHSCIASESQHPWLHKGKLKILELGCGHALAASVFVFYMADHLERLDLQDYNDDVLRNITMRNVCLWDDSLQEVNQSLREVPVSYWGGDWGALLEKMPKHEFDLILAAETLYSENSFEKQWKLMKHCLKPGTGRIWIASKRYYYGVGGGTFAFSEMVQDEANVETVLEIRDGLSNVREILEVTMKE
eukprot:CAMPEP_0117438436 /NCGR_PEP_ID=MMETSP0759-20121206/2052_1 /TAXON_ID=63605 /ORGANISM="Percolomonas cosmopolitus, Strain WS" /LENGTH=315 /DNA_ID=CAMNT_0005230127 /DNA_START=780 /DNA_END=1727 /DNA_ORIENTATION=+